MVELIGLYLLGINALTFVVFAADKRRATDGDRRVPEKTLLQLALIGGTAGAFAGQQVLRHKTRKEPFRTQLWLVAFLQVVLLVGAAIWTWA
jgi:uncharacterized membrane protein YsdA (DUF1294 family)